MPRATARSSSAVSTSSCRPRPGKSAVERQLAIAPGAPARLGRRLVERELVGPRREAALAAVGVELAQDREQRVVGALRDQVLDVGDPDERRPAADLEVRRLEQQRVQPPLGVGAPRARQLGDPVLAHCFIVASLESVRAPSSRPKSRSAMSP